MSDAIFAASQTLDEFLANAYVARAEKKFYLRSVAMYGDPDDPRFASIFLPIPQGGSLLANRVVSANLAIADIAGEVLTRRAEGYLPLLITATSSVSAFRYTMVFEHVLAAGGAYVERIVRSIGTWDDFAADDENGGTDAPYFGFADQNNYNLLSLDAFTIGSPPTIAYCGVFSPTVRTTKNGEVAGVDPRQNWNAQMQGDVGDLPFHLDPRYDAARRGWARIEAFAYSAPNGAANTRQLVAVWRSDSYLPWPDLYTEPDNFEGGTVPRGPLGPSAVSQTVSEMKASGYWPVHVNASGSASDLRFFLVFAPAQMHGPLPRRFRVVRSTPTKTALTHVDNVNDTLTDVAHLRPLVMGRTAPEVLDSIGPFASGPPAARQSSPGGRGGPGPSGPSQTNQPFPATSSAYGLDPGYLELDRFMHDQMRARDVRMGQLAIARNGALKFAHAYTYAEEGYPLCQLSHLIRLGSVSKPLTAMAVVRGFAKEGRSLEESFTTAYQLPANAPKHAYFDFIRVTDALRHRTGWGDSGLGTSTISTSNFVPSLDGTSTPPIAGDLQKYLAKTTDPLLLSGAFPRLSPAYNNWNFAALGEIAAAVWKQSFASYEQSMRDFMRFGPIDANRYHVCVADWPESRALGDAPCHNRFPGWAGKDSHPGEYFAVQYTGSFQVWAGGGGATMRAIDVVRVVSAMDPNAALKLGFSESEVRSMHGTYDPAIAGAAVVPFQGMAWGVWPEQYFTWHGDSFGSPVIYLEHNGEINGGSSIVRHVIPKSGPVSPSITIVLAFNHDTDLGGGELNSLLAIAQKIELNNAWPDGDLFEVV